MKAVRHQRERLRADGGRRCAKWLEQFCNRADPLCQNSKLPEAVRVGSATSLVFHFTVMPEKIWVFAHETRLIKDIHRIPTNPHVDEYVRDDNPLCRVPTLVLDAGEALFDSPVICEYLDSLHSGRRLIPPRGARAMARSPSASHRRWYARCQCVTAHGDDTPAERTIPQLDCSPDAGTRSCLKLAGEQTERAWGSITIGHIAVGCALGYFDIRYPDDPWRTRYPRLGSWYNEFEKGHRYKRRATIC